MILFDRFISEKFFKDFSLTLFSLSSLLLILFSLDFLVTDYRGFTFIPGLRIFSDRLFADTDFLATDTIEYYWGNTAIELIIGSILFVQIVHLLQPLVYPQFKCKLRDWRNFLLTLGLLIFLNLVFANLSI